MSELIPVIEELIRHIRSGRSCALCTVVKTKGSTPQLPGATMLLRNDHTTVGTLGGGCVEEEVKRKASSAVKTQQARLYDFLLDHDYGWDDGLICGGRMDVAIVPFAPRADVQMLEQAIARARENKEAIVPIAVQHGSKTLHFKLHLEVAPTVLIAGAGHVGQALSKQALDLGFQVVVIDDREEYANSKRFDPRARLIVDDIAQALRDYPIDPHCYVVIVTRGHNHDFEALEAVIRSEAGYIGMIGSKRKAKLLLTDLVEAGVEQALIERIHTPIGLPIGAVTVPEIAVSIVAQLIQQRRKITPTLVEGPFEEQVTNPVT